MLTHLFMSLIIITFIDDQPSHLNKHSFILDFIQLYLLVLTNFLIQEKDLESFVYPTVGLDYNRLVIDHMKISSLR